MIAEVLSKIPIELWNEIVSKRVRMVVYGGISAFGFW